MQMHEFTEQAERLKKAYGGHTYPDERLKVIWEEVCAFEYGFMIATVTEFIGTTIKPPLLPDFRIATAKERERRHQKQKDVYRRDAAEFFYGSRMSDGDRGFAIAGIKRRVLGQMPDAEWDVFSKSLYDQVQ